MPTWLHFYLIGASVHNLKLVIHNYEFTIVNSQFEFILRAQKVHWTPARFFFGASYKVECAFPIILKLLAPKFDEEVFGINLTMENQEEGACFIFLRFIPPPSQTPSRKVFPDDSFLTLRYSFSVSCWYFFNFRRCCAGLGAFYEPWWRFHRVVCLRFAFPNGLQLGRSKPGCNKHH